MEVTETTATESGTNVESDTISDTTNHDDSTTHRVEMKHRMIYNEPVFWFCLAIACMCLALVIAIVDLVVVQDGNHVQLFVNSVDVLTVSTAHWTVFVFAVFLILAGIFFIAAWIVTLTIWNDGPRPDAIIRILAASDGEKKGLQIEQADTSKGILAVNVETLELNADLIPQLDQANFSCQFPMIGGAGGGSIGPGSIISDSTGVFKNLGTFGDLKGMDMSGMRIMLFAPVVPKGNDDKAKTPKVYDITPVVANPEVISNKSGSIAGSFKSATPALDGGSGASLHESLASHRIPEVPEAPKISRRAGPKKRSRKKDTVRRSANRSAAPGAVRSRSASRSGSRRP